MHICVSEIIIIGSDNGLSPSRRQAIIWTNAGILSIGPLGTKLSEKLIAIHIFSFKKMHLKMSSGKWRLFGLGLNELIIMKMPTPFICNRCMFLSKFAIVLGCNCFNDYIIRYLALLLLIFFPHYPQFLRSFSYLPAIFWPPPPSDKPYHWVNDLTGLVTTWGIGTAACGASSHPQNGKWGYQWLSFRCVLPIEFTPRFQNQYHINIYVSWHFEVKTKWPPISCWHF